MSAVIDLLYSANVRIIDEVSIKKVLELARIPFNEKRNY